MDNLISTADAITVGANPAGYAAILMPAGFFLSVLAPPPDPTE